MLWFFKGIQNTSEMLNLQVLELNLVVFSEGGSLSFSEVEIKSQGDLTSQSRLLQEPNLQYLLLSSWEASPVMEQTQVLPRATWQQQGEDLPSGLMRSNTSSPSLGDAQFNQLPLKKKNNQTKHTLKF